MSEQFVRKCIADRIHQLMLEAYGKLQIDDTTMFFADYMYENTRGEYWTTNMNPRTVAGCFIYIASVYTNRLQLDTHFRARYSTKTVGEAVGLSVPESGSCATITNYREYIQRKLDQLGILNAMVQKWMKEHAS